MNDVAKAQKYSNNSSLNSDKTFTETFSPREDAEPDEPSDAPSTSSLTTDPSDLVGMSFLADQEEGLHLRAKIIKAINDHNGQLAQDSSRLKFACSVKGDTIEEIFTRIEMLDHLNNSDEEDLIELKFKSITSHKGPLPKSFPHCKSRLLSHSKR